MRFLLTTSLCFCLLLPIAAAESINDLKKKQKQTKEKIELTNKLLNETQKSKKNTVSTINVLKEQITERQSLIKSLNSEISLLDNDLEKITDQKNLLVSRLNSLKKEYAGLVYHAYFYKNKTTYNQFIFILSSTSVNQAYRRLRYVQEYSAYRKEQSIEIQKVADELKEKEAQLSHKIIVKEVVVKNKAQESIKLQEDQKNKEKMLGELSKKEKKLREDLKVQQKQANELNNKIDQLIAREIAAAERRAEAKRKREAAAKNKKNNSTGSKDNTTASKNNGTGNSKTHVGSSTSYTPSDIMTKEENLIAGGFEKNVGRLPWPVKGIITGRFGVHPHPVFKGVEINNKGIYILTQQGADACSVYEGEVTQVFTIPGSNNAIIVKHGNYRTVYANLTSTYVKIGDMVTAKQKLGRVFVDDQKENKTELYFLVYRNSTLENPEKWLAK